MKTALFLAGSLLLGTIAAQDPVTSKPDKKATAAERMQELAKLRRDAFTKWREETTKARDAAEDGGAVKAISMRPDYGPIADKALQYAKEFAGTDDAVQFLLMVVNMDQKRAKGAIETLLSDHVDSPELAKMGRMLPFLDRVVDEEFAARALDKLLKSKSVDVRGWAQFAKHGATIENADRDSDAYKTAKAALLVTAEQVADKGLAQQIRGAIEEREKFGVGCTAPDIEGVDLDGVAFKLSDYRGKVIFLDFWGDW
ncbi:MAG TPA: hypothetical protein ENI87_13720 [bacterium]|nr:hypothetical protein [bacterium]